MPSILNDSSWHGPNAAGMGGTPAPFNSDDGYGLHATQYSGDATKGKNFFPTGSHVAGAPPARQLVVDATGTHVY